ncbi:MAG TPA: cupin domain-containing protein [Actinomycetota bacterium]|nr:cupin domain-containing protein [Actinomycetota bacterium]
MAGVESKQIESGVRRSFDRGHVDVVQLAGASVGRVTLEPGWKWSECVKPLAKTELCQAAHVGYVVAGTLAGVMGDGTTFRLNAGDSYTIAPGHDAWVEGDDLYVAVEFESLKDYAKEA